VEISMSDALARLTLGCLAPSRLWGDPAYHLGNRVSIWHGCRSRLRIGRIATVFGHRVTATSC
jgi:hypothetical protein